MARQVRIHAMRVRSAAKTFRVTARFVRAPASWVRSAARLTGASRFSELDSEAKHRPAHGSVEEKLILVVVNIEVAVAKNQGVTSVNVQARVSGDLIREIRTAGP